MGTRWDKLNQLLDKVTPDEAEAIVKAVLTKDLAPTANRVIDPVLGALDSDLARDVNDIVLDSRYTKEWHGDLLNMLSQDGNMAGAMRRGIGGPLNPLLDMIGAIPGQGDSEREAIRQAHDEGGGRGVWEERQGDRNRLQRGVADVLIDPTTYLSAGTTTIGKQVVKQGAGLAAEGGAKNLIAGNLIRGAGGVLRAGEAPDYVAGKILGKGASLVGEIKPVDRAFRKLGELTPHEKARQATDRIFSAWDTKERRVGSVKYGSGNLAQGPLPELGPQTGPPLPQGHAAAPDRLTRKQRLGNFITSPLGIILNNNATYARNLFETRPIRFIDQPVTDENGAVTGTIKRLATKEDEEALVDIAADLLFNHLSIGSKEYQDRVLSLREYRKIMSNTLSDQFDVTDPYILETAYSSLRKGSTAAGKALDYNKAGTLPHERWVGRNPFNDGTGREVENVSRRDLDNYISNIAAGRQIAGGGSDGAAKLMPADEFHDEMVREFGEMPREVTEDLYKRGMDRAVQVMAKSAESPREWREVSKAQSDAEKKAARSKKGKPVKNNEVWKHNETGPTLNNDDYEMMVRNRLELDRSDGTMLTRTDQEKSGAGFYTDKILAWRAMFPDDESFEQFLGLVAATSIRNPVATNAKDAMRHFATSTADPQKPLLDHGMTRKMVDRLRRKEKPGAWKEQAPGFTLGVQQDMASRRQKSVRSIYGMPNVTQKTNDFRDAYFHAIDRRKVEQAYTPQDHDEDLDWLAKIQSRSVEAVLLSNSGVTGDVWHMRANFLPDGPSADAYQIIRSAGQMATDKMRAKAKSRVEMGVADEVDHIISSMSTDDMQAAVWAYKRMEWTGNLSSTIPAVIQKDLAGNSLEEWSDAKVEEIIRNMHVRAGDLVEKARKGKKAYREKPHLPKWNPKSPSIVYESDKDVTVFATVLDPDSAVSEAAQAVYWKTRMQDMFDRGQGGEWYRFYIEFAPEGTPKSNKVSMKVKYKTNTRKDEGETRNIKWSPRLVEEFRRYSGDAASVTTDPEEHIVIADRVVNHMDFFGRYAHRVDAAFNTLDKQTKRMNDLIDSVAEDVRLTGEVDGKSFRLNPHATNDMAQENFIPWSNEEMIKEMGDPYIVALGSSTSAPVPIAEMKKTMKAYMEEMKPLFYSPETTGKAMFGVFIQKQGDEVLGQFDISIALRDPKIAQELAAAANQQSIYRPKGPTKSEQFIDVEGGERTGNSPYVTGQEVSSIANELLVGDKIRSYTHANSLSRSFDSTDMLDEPEDVYDLDDDEDGVLGIVMGDPISRKATSLIERFRADKVRMPEELPGPLPDVPLNTGEYSILSGEENQDLLTMLDGEYAGQFLDKQKNLFNATMTRLKNNGITWSNRDNIELIMKKIEDAPLSIHLDAKAKAQLKKNVREYIEDGFDPLTVDPKAVAYVRLQRAVEVSMGLEKERPSKLAKIRAAWSSVVLLSPRYHTGNMASGYLHALIQGDFKGIPGPAEIVNQILRAFHGDKVDDFFFTSKVNETADRFGKSISSNIVGTGSQTMVRHKKGAAELFRGILGEKAGGALNRIIDANGKAATGGDAAFRGSLWSDKISSRYEELAPELEGRILKRLREAGYDLPEGFETLPSDNPGAIFGYYSELLGPSRKGLAERITRDVAETVNIAEKDAMAAVHNRLFSYYRTNADEMISKFIPFHYWASRSTRFYFEELMRNPAYLVNTGRMLTELEQASDEPGFNARQKGWVRFMSGPAGFSLLANPDALLGMTKAYGLMDGYTPEGETEVGQVMRWMKSLGLGIYPWVDGIFNMSGVYGNTFEPDMIGIRHRAIVGASVNALLAETGNGPGGSPYADLNAAAREKVSTWVSSFAPDWLSQPVPAVAAGNIGAATLDRTIEARIVANSPGMTGQELFEIMSDPDSEEYKAAWKQVARAGFIGNLLTFTSPTGIKARENTQDARNAGLSMVYSKAAERGIRAEDVNPVGDAKFAANFERVTGKKWSPSFYDKAQFEKDMITATPQARPYVLQFAQYYDLPRQFGLESVDEKMNKIRSGEFTPPGYGNVPYEQRGDLAEAWLASQPGNVRSKYMQLREARKAFRAVNPEFDGYQEWRQQMYNVQDAYGKEDGLARYREMVRKGNPNVDRFFADKIREIANKTNDPLQRRAMLDQATMSADYYLARSGIPKKGNSPSALPTSTQQSMPFDPAAQMQPPSQSYGQGQGMPTNRFEKEGGGTNWNNFMAAFGNL